MARLESEPGEETQIDYGKMGTREVETRRRVVYAFCGKLCASRLPYIQYCTSQDAFSFALSFSTMLEFYGGSTKRVNLDNLKSGVITPDIYDPTINRTFAEACEHYGVLVDPARVASPKQKGKVERMVPDARELYKRLDALYPQATLGGAQRACSPVVPSGVRWQEARDHGRPATPSLRRDRKAVVEAAARPAVCPGNLEDGEGAPGSVHSERWQVLRPSCLLHRQTGGGPYHLFAGHDSL